MLLYGSLHWTSWSIMLKYKLSTREALRPFYGVLLVASSNDSYDTSDPLLEMRVD
jgi:hypothetical protein